MTVDEAIAYFGSPTRVCRALGIRRAAIGNWCGQVPLLRQYQLERLTDGALKAHDPLFDKMDQTEN